MGKADGNAEEAPGRAARAPSGRLEMDRYRRHIALWRLRLQPRRRAHRAGGLAQPACGQGLGQTGVSQPRRLGRARDAQYQGRVETITALCAGRRGGRAGSGRHDPVYGAKRRLSRPENGSRAPQCGEGAAVSRCRRVNGRLRALMRGAVLGRTLRVQTSRVFLLPQLCL